jgi:hypothetical protein
MLRSGLENRRPMPRGAGAGWLQDKDARATRAQDFFNGLPSDACADASVIRMLADYAWCSEAIRETILGKPMWLYISSTSTAPPRARAMHS